MPDLELHGCRTTPLLSYLKALGVFRHVAKADPAARLWWRREGFAMLRSRFDESGLVKLFMEEYEPSPITSPWNGGSGYYGSTKVPALKKIEESEAQRLQLLRQTITSAREILRELGLTDKPSDEQKLNLLRRWRATCPGHALEWLDAAFVLTQTREGRRANPLLGSGGGDGRLDFSKQFLSNLDVALPELNTRTGARKTSETWLLSGLFDHGEPELVVGGAAKPGMFDPGLAGTPNASSDGDDEEKTAAVNPWDVVLAMEGVLMFAGGVARSLDADHATFPFTVRDVTRVGTSLSAEGDSGAKGESWLPLWSRPVSVGSLSRLFAEGRVQDARAQARAGREALGAARSNGVERGVVGFERIVFAQRWGRDNVLATRVGSVRTNNQWAAEITGVSRGWLSDLSGVQSGSVRRCLAGVDAAAADLLSASDDPVALERWLLALSDTQLAVARRPESREPSRPGYIRVLGGLDRRIVTGLEDLVEHRLACALATVGRGNGEVGLRSLIEPVAPIRNWGFTWGEESGASNLGVLRPVPLLIALASRGTYDNVPLERRARLADITAFLTGATDDARLARLAYAFTLCVPCDQRRTHAPRRTAGIDRLYAACRLVTGDPVARRPGGLERDVRRAPDVIPMLAAGNGALAGRSAARRLRADGLAPARAIESIDRTAAEARRIAAALAFPLHPDDRRLIEHAVLTPEPTNDDIPSPEGVLA